MLKNLTITRLAIGVAMLALLLCAASQDGDACGDYMDEETREFVETAIAEAHSPAEIADAKDAIEILRSRGWMGVYALSSYDHRVTLDRERLERKGEATPEAIAKLEQRRERIRAALDKVAGQKDAHASRLFWHTDLDAAKADAAKRRLPILSLRLLGNLDEDLSCANSRYFRTVLYADARVHHYLRQHYVLHWKSVRPVPVMTIDFGDGRSVCRTVTGNSAHYILDAQGRPLDVIPGLYAAPAFRKHLVTGHALAKLLRGQDERRRAMALALHHGVAGARLDRAFHEDLERVGDARGRRMLDAARARMRTSTVANAGGPEAMREAPPSARRAAPVAAGKSVVETPAVRAIQPDVLDVVADTGRTTWHRIADLDGHALDLGKDSLALMRAKAPRMSDEAFARMAQTFRRSVRIDTVRNEYDLHRRVHTWFAKSAVGDDVERLNERVYDELFLTPSSDPWLGLVPDGAYSALDRGGLVETTTAAQPARPIAQASTSR